MYLLWLWIIIRARLTTLRLDTSINELRSDAPCFFQFLNFILFSLIPFYFKKFESLMQCGGNNSLLVNPWPSQQTTVARVDIHYLKSNLEVTQTYLHWKVQVIYPKFNKVKQSLTKNFSIFKSQKLFLIN